MTKEHFEKTPGKADRWFRAAIVLALLYGITFSLNSFFNWIFFFAAVYAFFMSYFTLPVQPKIFQGKRRPGGGWTGPTQFNTGTSQSTTEARIKRVIFSIVGGFFALMILFFIIGILNPEDQQQNVEDAVNEAMMLTPQELVNEGHQFFNEGNYDSADFYYGLAIGKDPGNMEAVYGKGIVLWQHDRKDEAMVLFEESYEGGYRYAWLSWVLADMHDKNGNSSRAISLYKESISLDSANEDSYNRLAELEPENRDKYLLLAQKYAEN